MRYEATGILDTVLHRKTRDEYGRIERIVSRVEADRRELKPNSKDL